MTTFNLGTNNLVEATDFTAYDPYFPTPGFTYFLRATLSQSSYLSFSGYVLIIAEFRIPPALDFRWDFAARIYPSPFPVNFSVIVPSGLPAGVTYRPLARLIKPFRGQVPDNIDCEIIFDDAAFQAL